MALFKRFRRWTNRRFKSKRPFTSWRKKRRIKMARMMNKWPKPEIKFAEVLGPLNTVVATGAYDLRTATPVSIAQGVNRNERIGSKIKSLRATIRIFLEMGNLNTTLDPTVMVRVALVTPRIEFSEFSSFFSTMPFTAALDHNVMTIHMDRVMVLSTSGSNPLSTGVAQYGNSPSARYIYKSIKFPRTITFRYNDPDVTPDQAKIYIVVWNGVPNSGASLQYNYSCKLSYVDI